MPVYNNYENIPARVFFQIRETGNLQLLRPKPKEKGLENIFIAIHDEYFIRSGNKKSEDYVRLRNLIISIQAKIATIKNVLQLLWFTKTTREFRYKWIDELNNRYGLGIDKDAVFANEVKRVLNIEIGIMQNDITEYQMEMDAIKTESEGVIFDYYERVSDLSDAHGRTLDEQMLLPMFVALEKSAEKKHIRNKTAKIKEENGSK